MAWPHTHIGRHKYTELEQMKLVCGHAAGNILIQKGNRKR